MKYIGLLFIALALLSCVGSKKSETKPYLVVLSMDGCRWDYPMMYDMPTLDSIAAIGVQSVIQPSFPTKTFPNHYTLATGLYPSNSGIVLNTFYNPEIDRKYKISDRTAVEDSRFYNGEPFWVTAEKQGVTSAAYFWVGSETKIKEVQPSIWKKYNSNTTPLQIADSVISWLQLPEADRPHLVSMYFDEPDHKGHTYGPNSVEVKEKVESLDAVLSYFCKQLNQLDIADQVNFIITSDHGMGEISREKMILLDQYLEADELEGVYGSNPMYLLEPAKGKLESVYNKLQNIEGLTVWKKEDVPERLHYSDNPCISSLVVVVEQGWSLFHSNPTYAFGGTHGYDNSNPDMNAIFYAFGPAFKQGYVHPTFANVNFYSIVTAVMNLEPAETDGGVEHIEQMLVD